MYNRDKFTLIGKPVDVWLVAYNVLKNALNAYEGAQGPCVTAKRLEKIILEKTIPAISIHREIVEVEGKQCLVLTVRNRGDHINP
jgi:hypothetical protein